MIQWDHSNLTYILILFIHGINLGTMKQFFSFFIKDITFSLTSTLYITQMNTQLDGKSYVTPAWGNLGVQMNSRYLALSPAWTIILYNILIPGFIYSFYLLTYFIASLRYIWHITVCKTSWFDTLTYYHIVICCKWLQP